MDVDDQKADLVSSRKGVMGDNTNAQPLDMASLTACPNPSATDRHTASPHSFINASYSSSFITSDTNVSLSATVAGIGAILT